VTIDDEERELDPAQEICLSDGTEKASLCLNPDTHENERASCLFAAVNDSALLSHIRTGSAGRSARTGSAGSRLRQLSNELMRYRQRSCVRSRRRTACRVAPPIGANSRRVPRKCHDVVDDVVGAGRVATNSGRQEIQIQ
jgi:hypothetical protein